jgi:hypothetical protein
MTRPSPQSFMRALEKTISVGPSQKYIVKATNQSADDHILKRFAITYVYLVVLRDLRLANVLPQGRAESCKAQLQAKKASRLTHQAAHQLLAELTIGNQPVYSLASLSMSERQTLCYCNSAVSDIHKTYNFVDNFLERGAKPGYVSLANRILTPANALANGALWDCLTAIFSNALARARIEIKATTEAKYADCKPDMLSIVDVHTQKILRIATIKGKWTPKTSQQLQQLIVAGGF